MDGGVAAATRSSAVRRQSGMAKSQVKLFWGRRLARRGPGHASESVSWHGLSRFSVVSAHTVDNISLHSVYTLIRHGLRKFTLNLR
jgi:hypothetical protein